jgi:hypothetical protein
MRKLKPTFFVIVLLLSSISCQLTSPNSSSQAPSDVSSVSVDAPLIDYAASVEPINVSVQLDDAHTQSGLFSPNGSTMSLITGDGTTFTLDVPPGALASDTAITMTAVKSIAGAPLRDGPLAAVQLEPSGLFFNQIATLTIIPAEEIPIENQIIFGYEGDGQDYHLAVVDPKSREIKIKLMNFSGYGVGFGADVEWAKNLSHQANGARERLTNEFGKITLKERQRQLLGETDDDTPSDWGGALQSNLEQFYDQVVQKELAAAELDCSKAKQAAEDLIQVERQKQLLGLSENDRPKIVDFGGKFDKLQQIYDGCKIAYHISGNIDDAHMEGDVCNVRVPFTLSGMLDFSFTPTNEKMGTYTFTGPFSANGAGSYLIYENGTMLVTGTGCVMGDNCATYDHRWTATRIDPKNCN